MEKRVKLQSDAEARALFGRHDENPDLIEKGFNITMPLIKTVKKRCANYH